MESLGKKFNLRQHLVGKKRVPITGPGDIEGHLGTDGRYYLLDFARLMPPEAPLPESVPSPPCCDSLDLRPWADCVSSPSEDGQVDSRGVFFRMLRPETVCCFRVPLSSDTFTGLVCLSSAL